MGGTDVVWLALRFAAVACLYAFLTGLMLVIVRDIRRERPATLGKSGTTRGRLLVLAGPTQAGSEFPLAEVTTIGRDPSCALVLTDDFVSSRHAAVVWRGSRLFVADLGSTNGTYLNNQRISDQTELRNGDVLQLGSYRLKVSIAR